ADVGRAPIEHAGEHARHAQVQDQRDENDQRDQGPEWLVDFDHRCLYPLMDLLTASPTSAAVTSAPVSALTIAPAASRAMVPTSPSARCLMLAISASAATSLALSEASI